MPTHTEKERRKNRRLDVDPAGAEISVPTELLKAEARGERWAGGGSAKEFVSIGEGRRGVKDVTDPSFRLQQANMTRERAGLSPLTSEELLRKEEGATEAQIIGGRVLEREEAIGESGVTELKERLTADPLDLSPEETRLEVGAERIAELGSFLPVTAANVVTGWLEDLTGKTFGRTTTEEFAETKTGKVLGTVTAGLGAAALLMSAPVALAWGVKTKIGASTAALIANHQIIGGALLLGLLDEGGNFLSVITDENRKKIDTYVGMISDFESRLSSLQSGVANGAYNDDPLEAVRIMEKIVNDIDQTEAMLKRLGNDNWKYHSSEEWREHMTAIETTRQNALERLTAIENIFARGTPAINPGGLVQTVEALTA